MENHIVNYLSIGIVAFIGIGCTTTCLPKEYLGRQPTSIGMVKIYKASEKEINRIVCKRDPKFVGMWVKAFADKKRKEIWFHKWEDLYYHIDLFDDPVKWRKEILNDNRIIEGNKLERWMESIK